jgi:P27 family predicted phage terminase small subunit
MNTGNTMTAPTPIRLRLLRGNPGCRRIPKEPHAKSARKFPSPPAFLSEYAVYEWNRVGPELWQLGLLTVLDETSFAAYCQSYGLWRLAEERLAQEDLVSPGCERNKVINPLQKIATQAARDLIRFGQEFALTPSSRARTAAGLPPNPPSKFGDLLA